MIKDWSMQEVDKLREIWNRKPRPLQRNIAQEMGRTERSIANKLYSIKHEVRNDWLDEEKIAFFDIEASNLKANLGNMISYAIKPLGGPITYEQWTRAEAIDRDKLDRRIIKKLIKDLMKYDLIVTYYGTGFDNKFIRTRAMILFPEDDAGFPPFGVLKHFDLYYAVRGNMSFYSNRLAVATSALGIVGKTPLPMSIHTDARLEN